VLHLRTVLYHNLPVVGIRGGLGPESGLGLYGRSSPLLGVSEEFSSPTAGGG